jgi:hypothetical protein
MELLIDPLLKYENPINHARLSLSPSLLCTTLLFLRSRRVSSLDLIISASSLWRGSRLLRLSLSPSVPIDRS